MTDFTFGKEYKLCSTIEITDTYKKGTSLKVFPYVVQCKINDPSTGSLPLRVVFSAPKRKFKRAHDRNRVKRLMREAFRFNKSILESELKKHDSTLNLFVIFTGTLEMSISELNQKTGKLFLQIREEIKLKGNKKTIANEHE